MKKKPSAPQPNGQPDHEKAPLSINHICVPSENPQLAADRLDTIYAVTQEHNLLYIDLQDSEGNVLPILAGVDDSTDPVKLIPLAKWLTAEDVEGKQYNVWNALEGKWLPIQETKMTREGWLGLKHSAE